MREVTKDEFYKRIYDERLNVHPKIVTGFPYTSVWNYLDRFGSKPYGKTVDRVEGGLIKTSYFVEEV